MPDQGREFPALAAPTVTGEESAVAGETHGIEAERLRWEGLARRIAAGDAAACDEFRDWYAAGVRVLLRRSVGRVGLESLVDETLSGAVAGIEQGAIGSPTDFVRFVRSVAERQRAGAEGRLDPNRQTPALTSMDRLRLRESTKAIEAALATFTSSEREILVGYYSRGMTRQDLERSFRVTGEEIDALRTRLQEMIRPRRERKQPARERRLPLQRRTAAAS